MITMKNIILEDHPTLRLKAKKLEFPLTEEDLKLAADMLEFLHNSQDEEIAEKYELRAGVGIAAPQLNVSKQLIALLIPGEYEDDEPFLDEVMVNPRIISHSIQQTALSTGEGCLSVDREVPGYVPRANRITLRFQDLEGNTYKEKFEGYPAIVIQHEIDHLNGILFYDRINEDHPLELEDESTILI